MATLTNDQIEQKKQLLVAKPLNEEELEKATGAGSNELDDSPQNKWFFW